MTLKLITAATAEPVTLARAKEHLRVDGATEDALIGDYLRAARDLVERLTGWALQTQTWDLYLDAFPAGDTLTLPRWPLQSVTGAYYTVDTVSEPGRIWLKTGYSWPGDTLQPYNGVRVRFVAGYTSASLVPQNVVNAILLLLGMLYENRELGEQATDLVGRLLPDRVPPA
jgi:uncharacterized phiE125 gp8 family phage protein